MASVQPGTRRGTFFMMIGWRNTVPPRMLRMVPFGERHIFFQAELLDPRLVGRDGRAFDADPVLFDGVGRIDGDLVVAGVTAFDRQVVIEEIDAQIGQDQLVLDHRPDDPGHFVAVDLDDRVFDRDLGHALRLLSARVQPWRCCGAGVMLLWGRTPADNNKLAPPCKAGQGRTGPLS